MKTLNELSERYSNEHDIEALRREIRETIRKLENDTQSKWLVYWTSNLLKSEFAGINNKDIEFIRNIIENNKHTALMLDITSQGGEINAIESIMQYLLESFEKIDVVVPFMVRSSAALLCLISEKIYMGPYSFLGTIAPILFPGGLNSIRLLKKFENLLKSAIETYNQLNEEIFGLKNKIQGKCKNSETFSIKNNKKITKHENPSNNSIGAPIINEIYEDYKNGIKHLYIQNHNPIRELCMEYVKSDSYDSEVIKAVKRLRNIAIKALEMRHLKGANKKDIENVINALLKDFDITYTDKNISRCEAEKIGLRIFHLEKSGFEREVLYLQNLMMIAEEFFNIRKVIASGDEVYMFQDISAGRAPQNRNIWRISPFLFNDGVNIPGLKIVPLKSYQPESAPGEWPAPGFYYDIQSIKMRELWDNEEDKYWDQF